MNVQQHLVDRGVVTSFAQARRLAVNAVIAVDGKLLKPAELTRQLKSNERVTVKNKLV